MSHAITYHVKNKENPLKNIICVEDFLDSKTCNDIMEKADKTNAWTTKRHKNYPTTDILLQDIKGLNASVKTKLISNIIAKIKTCYELEDGCTINPFDLFVVKYDATGQSGLDIHRDSSEISFVLLLSNPDDFKGGGTYYKEHDILLNPNKQGSLALHCGKTKHSGNSITQGKRYILIGFMNVKSNKILNISSWDKDHMKMKMPDKRFYDYLWIDNNIQNRPFIIYINIINLKHRHGKLKTIKERIANLKVPNNIQIKIHVKEANAGNYGVAFSNWTRLRSKAADKVKKYYSREITKGEIGCFNSHIEIIKDFNIENKETSSFLLILEDDANFTIDFIYRIYQSITEMEGKLWDAIDFGGQSIDNKTDIKITDSIIKKGALFQTHSIIYSLDGVKKIQNLDPKIIIPWDDFLNAVRKENPIDELNNLYDMSEKFIMYNSYVKLSWQNSNNIHDTENSDSVENCYIVNESNITIKDNFDLINYYSYSNVNVNIEKVMEFFVNSNKNMWKFNINNLEGSFTPKYINKWKLSIDNTRKLVGVLALGDDSSLELYQHNVNKIKTVKNKIYIFPIVCHV